MCHSQSHEDRRAQHITGLRASDEEREWTAGRLQSAAAEGRLTISELEERLETAWVARTRDQLTGLTHDLGGGMAHRRRRLPWHPAVIWAVPVTIWLLSSVVLRALGA
jgi:hypothetical protein